ncbi:type II toxin-antitoxin system RelE/ParE family toxin [Flavitalea sp. BT771]|uniref:type II toxin-antitoxin system RelE/ParE family toxin n=1 Tax=Flavitalea sp. BT771 TaxID=3063329 RepID=UPI0026E42A3C|nr:type II toxin-antitoxin system RelE/ParE family toxin [Flavitalea sp. BT771]MDO6430660.1 type II toxin-antitoxin system RelE/ParE family toxin [Flavitalea sp. BT771]MDV6219200.1 type II toxin-antitoxin system RelE/ParE family toxin [Flavitalea sp. BT771]
MSGKATWGLKVEHENNCKNYLLNKLVILRLITYFYKRKSCPIGQLFINLYIRWKLINIGVITFYKKYFEDFFVQQKQKVKDKIIWTFRLIEELPQIPESYLKHLSGTDGLYEIRIQSGSDIFRVFCFFDQDKLIILINGFQKKTQKTPGNEIVRAIQKKRIL